MPPPSISVRSAWGWRLAGQGAGADDPALGVAEKVGGSDQIWPVEARRPCGGEDEPRHYEYGVLGWCRQIRNFAIAGLYQRDLHPVGRNYNYT